jgi:uncharacterized membrane protein
LHLQRVNPVHALLFGLIAAAAWLRLRNLGADSIWYDEAVSWLQSKGSLRHLLSATAKDNYPPLHNLLLFAVMNISGTDAEWVLRLPSALLGIANIVAIYWLGTLIGGRVAGVFAAVILAASSMHIYYSQEARMYSLLALAATLYAASGFYFVKFPTTSRAALIAVCGLALVYSHPYGTLNWIAITIGMSANILLTSDFPRQRIVQWRHANTAIAVGFLPWAVILIKRAGTVSGRFWIPYPSVDYVLTQIYWVCGGQLAGAALLAGAAIAPRANLRATLVLLAWIIGPFAVALIASLVATPILLGRYLIGELPALAMLAALGMAHIATNAKWWARIVAVLLLAVAPIANLTNVSRPRDDWRTVGGYLQTRLEDSDCVLVYPAWQADALSYYIRKPFCMLRPWPLSKIDLHGLTAGRLFVVIVDDSRNDLNSLREKVSAFGLEGGRMKLRNFSIVEYTRRP